MLQSNRSFQVLNNMTNLKSGLSPLIECPCRFETKIWRIISFLQRSDQEDQRIVFVHSHNWKVLFPIIVTSWSPSLPWQSSQSSIINQSQSSQSAVPRWLKPWRNVFRALRPPVQRWASHHFCFYIFCHERFGDVGGTGNQDLSVHPYFFVSTLNHCFDHDDHKAWQIRPLGVEIIASDKCQPPPRLHDVPGERWLPSHL